MSTPWQAPTHHSIHGTPAGQRVRCSYCPTRTAADMLVEYPAGSGQFMCDGCRETIFRTGQQRREDFFAALGAPAADVAAIKATAEIADGPGRAVWLSRNPGAA